jgi:ribosomal protein S18 acetylase RimI-like enzyme
LAAAFRAKRKAGFGSTFMSLSSAASRLADFYQRHGFFATLRRGGLALRRGLFRSRSVIFYCDLAGQTFPPAVLPGFLKVERKRSPVELSPADLDAMTSFWNPDQARRNIQERFGKGASLWLIRSHDNLAGYGWTLQGCTIEPHYFPLGEDDVQFLDFHVFPKHRGRAIDWFLMTQILHRLGVDGLARAYGEAAEWNQASLSSFKMTPFRRLGSASKVTILGRTVVSWTSGKTEELRSERPRRHCSPTATGRKECSPQP